MSYTNEGLRRDRPGDSQRLGDARERSSAGSRLRGSGRRRIHLSCDKVSRWQATRRSARRNGDKQPTVSRRAAVRAPKCIAGHTRLTRYARGKGGHPRARSRCLYSSCRTQCPFSGLKLSTLLPRYGVRHASCGEGRRIRAIAVYIDMWRPT